VDKIIILMTDGAAIVRASACRTLGLYVLYKPIYENSQIMSRVAKCFVDGTGDKNLNVRIKAAWSLANYCDALIKSTTESTKIQVPDNLIFALFQASLKAALDNDKVRSNGVRALGNFARIAPPSILQSTNHLTKILNVLLNNLNLASVKVRWNACYGVSNLFQNEYLSSLPLWDWSGEVYNGLLKTVSECDNLKTKINACYALSIPIKRSHYGAAYAHIFSSLLHALQTSHQISDFSQYKYKETLIQQLKATISHLILLGSSEDFQLTKHLFLDNQEQLLTLFGDPTDIEMKDRILSTLKE